MFIASARRTESNPKTAAAILARGGKLSVRAADVARRAKEEHDKQEAQIAALPAPVVAKTPHPVASVKALDPKKPDLEMLETANRLSDSDVQEIIDGLQNSRGQYRPSFQIIMRRICRAYRVTPRSIASDSRKPNLILARQAIYYWAYRLTNLSSKRIGDLVSGRDHTTVLYGVGAYRAKRAKMGRKLRSLRSEK